ncbi:MAG: methionyl-tRNA synthetase [Ramalina farinacea]|uniref:Probable methionine--tRNA ligase, mitochondrial n=1 Tax=Ramalina farinacea TaxID=258253 RepID=A0AA43U073_9LECA|nr:methionyl-tRNA synthetase [Ramalina farinacea]
MLGKAGLSRLSLTSKRAPSPGWVCPRCRSARVVNTVGRRHSSTAASRPDKPYYVTSPIFYVNAAPHIGHLYTLVLTDVLKRWHALLGKRSILCTGTDEHGMKIQRAAAKAGSEPRPFCDEMHQPFRKLAQAANVDWDHFIRTSDADHRYTVEHVWLVLMEWGWIYEKKHQGWYSVSDETFYPESTVQLAIDPATGRKFMASRETGKEVEWTSETNFHFRMSRLRDALLEFYKENPKWIVPETRMKEVVAEVEAGLQDLSISRPRDRLSWGIPCPGEPDQTIYVWVDALMNYLTKAKYPMLPPGEEHKGGWPADCHVIGKDIVRFHAIYWPALLMALKLPLPKRILTHAHWTLGKQKMSKSTGMVVNPFFAISRFGVDCMRWYLVLDGGIKDDSAYDNSFIIERYKKGLQGGLGNLVSRVTKGRAWSVRRAVQDHGESSTEQLDQDFRACLQRLPASTMGDMEELNSGDALAKIMNVIYDTNAYLQHTAPWDLKEEEDQERLDQIIYLCAESIRICGILLQPFMPDHMFKLLDMLGVDDEARYFANTQYGSDLNYGTPKCSMEGSDGVLFSPLTSHN